MAFELLVAPEAWKRAEWSFAVGRFSIAFYENEGRNFQLPRFEAVAGSRLCCLRWKSHFTLGSAGLVAVLGSAWGNAVA